MRRYIDDDEAFGRWCENIHKEKKAVSPEGLKKRYWYNMNGRIRAGSYKAKNIKVLWSYQEFLEWWDDNLKIYEMIVEHGLTPSIDRIDSNAHYEAKNCRWLPNDVNRALGEVEYLIGRMKTLQGFLKENEQWLKR